jgi:hypothetical protein
MIICLIPNGEQIAILLVRLGGAVADIQLHIRSTAFFYVGASTQAGQLLSSPIVYVTMKQDVWLPVYLGFGLFGLATVLSIIIPSKAPEPKWQSQTTDTSDDDLDRDAGGVTASDGAAKPGRGLGVWARDLVMQIGTALHWAAYDNRPIGLMLLSLLITMTAKYAAALELQYITKRYNWSWEEVSTNTAFQHDTALTEICTYRPASSYLHDLSQASFSLPSCYRRSATCCCKKDIPRYPKIS